MVCHVVRGDFSRDLFEVNIHIFDTAHFHSRSIYILIFRGKVSMPNIQFLLLQGCRAIMIEKDKNPKVQIILYLAHLDEKLLLMVYFI